MTKTKSYGIGYTIFEFEGDEKRPLGMIKARPGNLYNEMASLQKRLKKIGDTRKVFDLIAWSFLLGYSVQVMTLII